MNLAPFRSPVALSDAGLWALQFAALPDDVTGLAKVLQGLLIHEHMPEVYGIKENPLPWLQAMLSGVEHANFFEARSTEYSKAATRGQWQGEAGVWTEFDKLMSRRGENVLPAE